MKLQLSALLMLFSLLSSYAAGVVEEPAAPGEAFLVYLENDSRRIGGPGSDQAYSNGIKFTMVSAEDRIPGWAQLLMNGSGLLEDELQKSKKNFGISLGHQIYTPNNIKDKNLIKKDRPYGAWLYLGFSTNFRTESHSNSLELYLGVVGPEAQGEEVQNGFHHAMGTYPAEGWKHQLKSEPTVQMSYQQRVKFYELYRSEDRTYFDVLPYYGLSFGNVKIDAHVGGLVRFGSHIPDDFGPSRPSAADGNSFLDPLLAKRTISEDKVGFYGFAGGKAMAVARDIFLDGNTFRKSHHVTKYPFVNETEFGVAANWQRFAGVWRFVVRSPEFEEKSKFNSFASISLSYLMD